MMDQSSAAVKRINPFFIHRQSDVSDDPWMDGMSMIRRKVKDGDKIFRARFKKAKKKKITHRFQCTKRAASAGAHLRDFMHATSMHGLKYAAEKEASWIERFLWIALFLACFCTAVFFIMRMWSKWISSPVLISVESTDFPNSQIFFPTVSVCNVNQVSNSIIIRMINTFPVYLEANMTKEGLLKLLAGHLRGDVPDDNEEYLKQLEDSIHISNLTTANLTQFMRRVAQPCSQMLLYCQWQSKPVNCSDIFQQVPSNQGFCCVYNLQTVHVNRKRNNAIPVGQEPMKAYGDGVQMGLTVLLDAQIDDYALTSSFYRGFKVLIHHPEDQPDPSTKGFAVSPGSEVYVGVAAESIFSTEDVRRLSPSARNCRFSYENDLLYFSRYSQSNCYMERMARRIARQCGCLPFYFLVGDESTPTCRFSQNSCIQSAFHAFHQRNIGQCPVNCNTTSYSADISFGQFPNTDFRTARMARYVSPKIILNDSYLQDNVALLHVFFRDRSGIQYRRDVRYEWQDFVSAVGGLLGLGVGFSLLSLMEILYFCGLRSCLRRRRHVLAPAPVNPLSVIDFGVNRRLSRHLQLHM